MRFVKRTDMIVLAAAVAGCFLFALFFTNIFGGGGSGKIYAEIYYKSELVKTIDLSTVKEGDFSLAGLPQVVFHIYSDGIAFVQSDCPDKICIKTGKISRPGQFAACLPNQVLLKIVSDSPGQDGPDIVIQ